MRGLMIARNGMAHAQERIDLIAENIANLNTHGYKRRVASSAEFAPLIQARLGDIADAAPQPLGPLGFGAEIGEVATDERQGAMQMTGYPLDVAIEGNGYFRLQTPDGIRLDRNGAFRQADDGTLVNPEGFPVLVNGQPLTAPLGAIAIRPTGEVTVGDEVVGTLDLEGADADTRLRVGWLESSNVTLAKEMTDLLEAARVFALNQRALRAHDEILSAANTIGKIG